MEKRSARRQDRVPSRNPGPHRRTIRRHARSIDSAENGNQTHVEIYSLYDPEISVNIYDLGLIYEININYKNDIKIKMTLTNPNCPVAGTMPESVGKSVEKLSNLNSIEVSLVWEPKWHKDLMSEEAKLALDIF